MSTAEAVTTDWQFRLMNLLFAYTGNASCGQI